MFIVTVTALASPPPVVLSGGASTRTSCSQLVVEKLEHVLQSFSAGHQRFPVGFCPVVAVFIGLVLLQSDNRLDDDGKVNDLATEKRKNKNLVVWST